MADTTKKYCPALGSYDRAKSAYAALVATMDTKDWILKKPDPQNVLSYDAFTDHGWTKASQATLPLVPADAWGSLINSKTHEMHCVMHQAGDPATMFLLPSVKFLRRHLRDNNYRVMSGAEGKLETTQLDDGRTITFPYLPVEILSAGKRKSVAKRKRADQPAESDADGGSETDEEPPPKKKAATTAGRKKAAATATDTMTSSIYSSPGDPPSTAFQATLPLPPATTVTAATTATTATASSSSSSTTPATTATTATTTTASSSSSSTTPLRRYDRYDARPQNASSTKRVKHKKARRADDAAEDPSPTWTPSKDIATAEARYAKRAVSFDSTNVDDGDHGTDEDTADEEEDDDDDDADDADDADTEVKKPARSDRKHKAAAKATKPKKRRLASATTAPVAPVALVAPVAPTRSVVPTIGPLSPDGSTATFNVETTLVPAVKKLHLLNTFMNRLCDAITASLAKAMYDSKATTLAQLFTAARGDLVDVANMYDAELNKHREFVSPIASLSVQ
jgi:hypothetical protein